MANRPNKTAAKGDPIYSAIAEYEGAHRRYSRIAPKWCAFPLEVTRHARAQIGTFDPRNGDPVEPRYFHTHEAIDAEFDRIVNHLRAVSRITPAIALSQNINRHRAHRALDDDAADLESKRIESGYARVDAALNAAGAALVEAEKRLYTTSPTTLAGMRSALAIAARRGKAGEWDDSALRSFLAGMVRQ